MTLTNYRLMTWNLVGLVGALLTMTIPVTAHCQQLHKIVYERPADSTEYTQQMRINVGDVPGHQVRVYELKATYKDDSVNFLGVPVVEEWNRGFSDYTNTNGRHSGYCLFVMRNGDKIHCRLEGTTHSASNTQGSQTVTYAGITTLTGGTGRFQGIRGTLRYSGFYDPIADRSGDKSEGEYWLGE